MADTQSADVKDDGDVTILLGVLDAVERDSRVTQRHLAHELGIALGLANAYLKRCAKKGLIKISQAPLNRYAYYLTPQGFAEKSRLTAEYLTSSFDFFRRARRDCRALLDSCRGRERQRIVLYGVGELAEVAVLTAAEAGIEIVCVVDLEQAQKSCVGRAVVPDLAAALTLAGPEGIHSIIVTDMRTPHDTFTSALNDAARHGIPSDCVEAPNLLRVTPRSNGAQS